MKVAGVPNTSPPQPRCASVWGRAAMSMVRRASAGSNAAELKAAEPQTGEPNVASDAAEFNAAESDADEAKPSRAGTVQALLEARADAAPDRVALIDGDTRLTHAALHTRANRLAHHLRALGVQPDTRVAVCMARSADLVVALLAIVKAGGAYVPLDPAYPAERLAYMLGDSAPALVLTHTRVSETVREQLAGVMAGRPVVDLNAASAPWLVCPHTAPDPTAVGLTPKHLAYVAYTSGSTGQPKGVANTIEGLANRLAWFADAIAREPPVTGMKTSICFVDSITEILQTLAAGGALVVFDDETAKDTRRFAEQVRRHRVSLLVVVPSLLTRLLDADPEAFASVNTLVCSGERLAPELARKVRTAHRAVRLLNFYGSSEVNGDATFHDCSADDDAPLSESGTNGAGSPIGRPIANLRVYLLDAQRQPVPVGEAGEIFVGGIGLARGYLGRPDLTAERFLDDPFVPGSRVYKTGDLARWREDGILEFLGRNDHQVKIRGHRVELGEVETTLGAHPAVRQVVVAGREDVPGDTRLVAYLSTCVPGREILGGLRERLRSRLPEYMVPSHFVFLDELPLTPTGKVDRLSLPVPTEAARSTDAPAVAPRDALEQSVWDLWRDILRVDRFGVFDDFFDIGGNSLLAVQLRARLEQAFAHTLPLNALLQQPTVAQLAAVLRGDAAATNSLVLIRPGSEATSVFFVHDGFGETLVYRKLAHRLRASWPVYGLCPKSAGGVGMVHTSIADMAAHYVAQVRVVQARGPYVLAGLCAGGVVAFEMARQLEQLGERMAALVLIDANDVAAARRIGRFALGELRRSSAELGRAVSLKDPLGSLRSVLAFAASFVALAAAQVQVRLAGAAGHRKARALRRCLSNGVEPPPALRALPVDQIYNLAEVEHRDPGTLKAGALLVYATQGNGDAGDEPFAHLYGDPLLGWGRRVHGRLERVDIGGGHYSMFQEPHVAALAATIQSHIEAGLAAPSPT